MAVFCKHEKKKCKHEKENVNYEHNTFSD